MDGFIGKACLKYITYVSSALSYAHEVHKNTTRNQELLDESGMPDFSMDIKRINDYSPEEAMYGYYTIGVGNETNIVVHPDDYDDVMQRVDEIDSEVTECLFNLVMQIEEMCETIYILPATLKEHSAVMDDVKQSLPDFRSLTEQTLKGIQSYVYNMEEADES